MKQKFKTIIKSIVLSLLNYFLIPLFNVFSIQKKSKAIDIEELNCALNSFAPNSNSSCKTENKLVLPYKYDLQIIIPAFNAANTLERCIKSVLEQKTIFSYILIIINDGSTDNTTEILKQYISNQNIKIINQENRGFSGARNRGLENIYGQYIMFLDSDDYLEKDAITNLMTTAKDNDYDIVQGGYEIFYDDNSKREFHYNEKLMGYPWGKVYKSEIFKDISFPLDYWFEDTICDMIIHPRAKKWICLPVTVYCYYINPNGISKNFGKYNKTIDTYYITESLLEDKKLLGQEFDIDALKIFLKQVVMNFKRISLLKNEKINKYIFLAHSNLEYMYFDGNNSFNKEKLNRSYKNLYVSLFSQNYFTYYLLCRFWNFI